MKSTEEKEVEITGINCDQLSIVVVGLERRLSSEGQEVLLQRTPIQFPEPMPDTSQLPLGVKGGEGGLAPSSSVRGHLHTQRIPTQRHKIKIIKGIFKKLDI